MYPGKSFKEKWMVDRYLTGRDSKKHGKNRKERGKNRRRWWKK